MDLCIPSLCDEVGFMNYVRPFLAIIMTAHVTSRNYKLAPKLKVLT
jgi:hypothetical protein